MQAFSPRETVSELDRFIIGQDDAKKAVAIALRNRWRRQQLEGEIKEEILPKNILMVGPTGVGKTEISRRLSKLAQAPFIKVEATKFTEVGYVGRDVEQIIRDLIEIAITMVKQSKRKEVKAKAERNAEEKILDILVSKTSGESTRENFRQKLFSPLSPNFDLWRHLFPLNEKIWTILTKNTYFDQIDPIKDILDQIYVHKPD